MLVISRKHNESIVIGDRIVIEVLEIGPSKIRLGIAAPDNIRIVRGELLPKPPLAEHLDRVRQNRGMSQDSIEIELPLGAGEAAEMSNFNGQEHRSRPTVSGSESSRGDGSSGLGSAGLGSTGVDSTGAGSTGAGSTGLGAEEIGGEATSSQLGGRVAPAAFGPDGYRSGHSAGYTSSRPPRYDASRPRGYDTSGRERAISCEAARQAWQASSRSSRSSSPRRDGSSSPPRRNARSVSPDRSRSVTTTGYQQPTGYQQQPTWAEIAWSHLETMTQENHDDLNEEALAYQIVWQSWGSTAAPLVG